MSMTTLFVYGTLKRGCWNHDRFCRGALDIQAARMRGRLYELSSGIPVLQVLDDDVLAVGTGDVLADIDIQEHQASMLTPQGWEPPEDWDVVYGELLTFDDPTQRLPSIDRLEGFRPGRSSLYRRVLTPAITEQGIAAAWVYITDSNQCLRSCRRLKCGRWEQESRTR